MSHLFDYVISGDCVAQRKTYFEGIEKLQKHFGCALREMVMVDDHDHDMEAAHAFSAQAIRASWNNHWDHDHCSKAHKQFYCTTEFQQWIMTEI